MTSECLCTDIPAWVQHCTTGARGGEWCASRAIAAGPCLIAVCCTGCANRPRHRCSSQAISRGCSCCTPQWLCGESIAPKGGAALVLRKASINAHVVEMSRASAATSVESRVHSTTTPHYDEAQQRRQAGSLVAARHSYCQLDVHCACHLRLAHARCCLCPGCRPLLLH